MKLKVYLFALFITGLLGNFAQVLACSCAGTESVCESFSTADAVFVGKVTAAKEQRKEKNENGKEVLFASQEIYFQVSESFFGVADNTQVALSEGFTTCDYTFEIGETYLVYAYAYEKTLTSNICSRTRRLFAANEDLPALRQLAKEITGTKISGVVGFLGLLTIEPMVNSKVKLQALEGKFNAIETLTDAKGEFLFSNIPAGKYKVSPTLPDLMKFPFEDKYIFEVEVTGKGCKNKAFTIINDSSFSGKLLNAQGQTVSNAEVEFIPANNNFDAENFEKLSAWSDTTDKDGKFSFIGVAPGNYYLAVNYKNPPSDNAHFPTTFYPNATERVKAQIFTVKPGQKLSGTEFTIPPPLKEIEISGTITRKDGNSPVDIQIYLMDVGKNQNFITNSKVIYDANGRFTIKGYEGRTYIFEAGEFGSENRQTVSSKFTLTKPISDLKLVINKESNEQSKTRGGQ